MQAKERTFKHLTKNDRLRMERWLNKGMKPREIADKLRVHISTVYRELKRGEYERLDGDTWEMVTAYSPDIAEERYQNHLREKRARLEDWSRSRIGPIHRGDDHRQRLQPCRCTGVCKDGGPDIQDLCFRSNHLQLYQKGIFLRITQVDLPRRGKKKQGYKKVKTRKDQARASAGESIERRPERVKNREEFGHWEMDTVYNKKDSTSKALLVLTERKTRREIIILIPNRKAETIVKALDALERKIGAVNFRKIFRTITVDNGSEFSAAEEMERSAVNKTIPGQRFISATPIHRGSAGATKTPTL